ncbi:hypothetical protein [Streptomyces sp. NPDC058773]|uniref:hypothetical protein n=1 Tax=Streptomyces sp. NPDC058773 TaxID=3346632 RepID=UPI0036A3F3AF
MVVGTAQLPGSPLPGGWPDTQVRVTLVAAAGTAASAVSALSAAVALFVVPKAATPL